MAVRERKAIVVGISGASSSGKTTLSRLLRDIFPNTFILHEDDFYKPEPEIPTKEDGLLDWDCAAALSIPAIQSTLHHIQTHGHPPPSFASKEDLNAVGHCPVPAPTIAALKARVAAWIQPGRPGHALLAAPEPLRMCLFDGFLLYAPSVAPIAARLDVKLFLRVSFARAKARREARAGYATIEGWWADPPGYVEKVVWPNYVANHAWMFEGGDVEGKFREEVLAEAGIRAQVGAGPDVEMGEMLEWAVETLIGALEELEVGRGEAMI